MIRSNWNFAAILLRSNAMRSIIVQRKKEASRVPVIHHSKQHQRSALDLPRRQVCGYVVGIERRTRERTDAVRWFLASTLDVAGKRGIVQVRAKHRFRLGQKL